MYNQQYLKNVVTLEYFPEKCTGCRMCVIVCPHRVLGMQNGKASVRDRDRCMECGACMRNCAHDAVKVRPGVGCAAAIAMSALRKRKELSCG
ncbi:MAG: mercury methylation ferredoxin HgcB [Spirochaetota bacterium]